MAAADPALRDRIGACSAAEAPGVLAGIAGEMGYTLEKPAVTALSDDEISAVAGGWDIPDRSEGELNPYSWFVSFMRRLMGRDEDENTPGAAPTASPTDR